MKSRTFLWAAACLALLTVGAPAGRPQPGPTPNDKHDPALSVAPTPSTPLIPPPDLPTVPGTQAPSVPSAPVTKPAPPPPSVEELLAALEAVQKQKADLEKQEQALKVRLQERLNDLRDRLREVGVGSAQVAPPASAPKDPANDFRAPPPK